MLLVFEDPFVPRDDVGRAEETEHKIGDGKRFLEGPLPVVLRESLLRRPRSVDRIIRSAVNIKGWIARRPLLMTCALRAALGVAARAGP